MKNISKKLISQMSFFAFAIVASSAAQASVSVVATGDLGKYSYSDTPNSSDVSVSAGSKFGVGGGLLFSSMTTTSPMGFEVGALYMNRNQNRDVSGTTTILPFDSYVHHFLEIPVTVRFAVLPILDLGVGGYWSHVIGSNSATIGGTNANFDDSALDIKDSDAGLQAGLGLHIPFSQSAAFMADARYSFGLVNQIADGAYTAKTRDIQFLVGLTFGIDGK